MIPLGRAARLLAGLRLRQGPVPIDAPQCTTIFQPPSMLHILQVAYTAVAMPDSEDSTEDTPTPALNRRQRRFKDQHDPTPTPDVTAHRPTVILEDDQLNWHQMLVPRSIWPVLLLLRGQGVLPTTAVFVVTYVCISTGHESFIVGGTVRDVVMGGKPKDLDIVTTATLYQVSLYEQ